MAKDRLFFQTEDQPPFAIKGNFIPYSFIDKHCRFVDVILQFLTLFHSEFLQLISYDNPNKGFTVMLIIVPQIKVMVKEPTSSSRPHSDNYETNPHQCVIQ